MSAVRMKRLADQAEQQDGTLHLVSGMRYAAELMAQWERESSVADGPLMDTHGRVLLADASVQDIVARVAQVISEARR